MNYLEQIDETIHNWFGSLTFEELEKIYFVFTETGTGNVTLFGLNEEDTEDLLNEIRDSFYSLSREEQIELMTEYYNK